MFSCVFCRSLRSARIKDAAAMANSIDQFDSTDTVSGIATSEMREMELSFPINLINVFEHTANWRDTKRSLFLPQENLAQHYYALIHRDPVLYRNLYRYLVFRYSTPSLLNRCMEQLFRWEKDFHGQNNIEALACMRLHLGSSQVLRKVIKSVQPHGVFSSFYNWYMPKKNWMRMQFRSSVPKSERKWFNTLYMIWNTTWYLVKPFIGASFFYFELIKDLVFTFLIYFTVMDLTKNNFVPTQYPFETGVVIGLFGIVVLTQLSFMVISVRYSSDVFEMCDHKCSKTKTNLFRLISLIFSPLMPAFLLANHVYYLQLDYATRRRLETLDEHADNRVKWMLFRNIERIQYRSGIHRRIYSFYRVTAAVIESFNMIVAIFAIVIVTSRPGNFIF